MAAQPASLQGVAELPAEPVTLSRAAASRRGKFKNGTWYCDCVPALPCLFLTVGNSARNKKNSGKQFYRCQKDKQKENSCDFFMWADQAKSREMNYLMTNRRSEGGPQLTQTQLPFAPSSSATATPGTVDGERRVTRSLMQTRLSNMPIRSRNADRMAVDNPASSGGETASGSDDDGDDDDVRSSSPTRATRRAQASSGNSNGEAASSSSRTASSRTLRSSGSQQQQQQQPSQPPVPQQLGTKRKKAPAEDEFSDFSDGEVQELAAIEERSGSGAVRSRNAFATPAVPGGRSIFAAHYYDVNDNGAGGAGGGGLPTPGTERSVRRVLFASAEQQDKNGGGAGDGGTGLQTPSTSKRQRNTAEGAYTPLSPSSYLRTPGGTTVTPGTSFSSDMAAAGGDIMTDVMDILLRSGQRGAGAGGSNLEPAVLDEVRGVLDRYSRRTAGFERGRDLSRREIQRQQRRIAELEQRNAALENSRDLDRAALRDLQRRRDRD
ncbi:hypothetical protein Micbo1qcDRAFT_157195 [Microdochium bolleyi]|uniref:GRF-type domain-containing protein n=1 Tax=Microdochium bolleyi TaxID=196109 RepID=A0A136JDS1_9PEZI|nr:hypothetical protein Micbo1qcDRAFT_157195 [Microdochium bolleyi]